MVLLEPLGPTLASSAQQDISTLPLFGLHYFLKPSPLNKTWFSGLFLPLLVIMGKNFKYNIMNSTAGQLLLPLLWISIESGRGRLNGE